MFRSNAQHIADNGTITYEMLLKRLQQLQLTVHSLRHTVSQLQQLHLLMLMQRGLLTVHGCGTDLVF